MSTSCPHGLDRTVCHYCGTCSHGQARSSCPRCRGRRIDHRPRSWERPGTAGLDLRTSAAVNQPTKRRYAPPVEQNPPPAAPNRATRKAAGARAVRTTSAAPVTTTAPVPTVAKLPQAVPLLAELDAAVLRLVTELQGSLGRRVSATMLTHILRGSSGPKTSSIVKAHTPPHVGALSWLPYRTARELVGRVMTRDGRVRES